MATYPGTEESVLSGLDFDLPGGGTVAIVGENGAGKSTLVKRLRFYDPTEGRIPVDDVDLRRIDISAWRQLATRAWATLLALRDTAR